MNHTDPINSLSALYGDCPHEAAFRDGTRAPVLIRALTLRQIPQYAAAFGDEPRRIELACGQKEGWADLLTDESHLAILKEADARNFSRAVAWAERQAEGGALLRPLIDRQRATPLPTLSSAPASASA